MVQAGGDGVTLLAAMITASQVPELRHAVTAAASAAGLMGEELEDFVLAVNELVTNAVLHGGGSGQLTLRRHDGQLTCQVSDHGPGIRQDLPALPEPTRPGRRGLWLAQHLTAGLVLHNTPTGLTATVATALPKAAQ